MMMWTFVYYAALEIINSLLHVVFDLVIISLFISLLLFIVFPFVEILLHWCQSRSNGDNPIVTTWIDICPQKDGVLTLKARNDSFKDPVNKSKKVAHSVHVHVEIKFSDYSPASLQTVDNKDGRISYLNPQGGPLPIKCDVIKCKNGKIPKGYYELIVRTTYNRFIHIFEARVLDIFIIEVKGKGVPDYWNKKHCESVGIRSFDKILYRLPILDDCPDDSKWWLQLIDDKAYLDYDRYFREI